MVNNFKKKNKKIWISIISVVILSLFVIGLIVYNKLGGDRNAQKIKMENESSQSTNSLSSATSSISFGDKPVDINPPSLTIPK